jgi:hypothetical protein
MKVFAASLIALALTTATALAQNAPPPAEVAGEPVSTLMFFTLGAALMLAVGLFAWFLRKKSNRAAAERALDPNNPANR